MLSGIFSLPVREQDVGSQQESLRKTALEGLFSDQRHWLAVGSLEFLGINRGFMCTPRPVADANTYCTTLRSVRRKPSRCPVY